jgi:tetratricopeptide (TPR) repeat protein
MIQIDPKRSLFRRQTSRFNPYRFVLLLGLIIAGLYLLLGYERGEVKELFLPTGTPTRVANSYALEAESQFTAGNLQKAIDAYQKAVELDPQNARLLADMARIQVYSSSLMTTLADSQQRLKEAKTSIDRATDLAPDDSRVQAIRALVYDWYANPDISGDESAFNLTQAEQAAIRALQLDSQNALALAFYAEILVDQQKWLQAEQNIELALARDDSLMDVHRVSGYVQESLSNYEGAISEYQKAAAITPNFTPLYIQIGTNYRTLGLRSTNELRMKEMYEKALEYYAKAVVINRQIGVKDPIPYLSIARTYSQMGEFFAASLNVRTALDMLPADPDIYGQLGVVYFKARNYESAIPALRCATYGCDAKTSCEVRRCNEETDAPIEVSGQPLNSRTLVYYYTYGSVLAGMHRPANNYCAEANKVLAEVRAAYGSDPEISAIISPSEQICAGIASAAP